MTKNTDKYVEMVKCPVCGCRLYGGHLNKDGEYEGYDETCGHCNAKIVWKAVRVAFLKENEDNA